MFSSVDSIWVLFGAVLVFSMQIGFTMVEVGLTRLKNSGNIIMKNVMDLCLGSVAFWIYRFWHHVWHRFGGPYRDSRLFCWRQL